MPPDVTDARERHREDGNTCGVLLIPDSGTCVAITCNLQRVSLREIAADIAQIAESR